MKRERERQESLALIVEEYIAKYGQPGLHEDDLLRDYSMSAELDPESFLEEVGKVRGQM